jgi:hypothetical protein
VIVPFNFPEKESDTVKQAQEKLSAAGYDVGSADGVMGPKTQDAIEQLQQDIVRHERRLGRVAPRRRA